MQYATRAALQFHIKLWLLYFHVSYAAQPPFVLHLPLITQSTVAWTKGREVVPTRRQPNVLFGVIKEFKLRCKARCAVSVAGRGRVGERDRMREGECEGQSETTISSALSLASNTGAPHTKDKSQTWAQTKPKSLRCCCAATALQLRCSRCCYVAGNVCLSCKVNHSRLKVKQQPKQWKAQRAGRWVGGVAGSFFMANAGETFQSS